MTGKLASVKNYRANSPEAVKATGSKYDAFKACWALTNLRPMWAKQNISKGAKRTHLI